MNIFLRTIVIIIFLIKIINSLPEKLMDDQSDRLLISLKTPIWFSEGESDGKSIKYSRVNPGALNDAIKFYENPESMAKHELKQDQYNNWYFAERVSNKSDESKNTIEKLRKIWEQVFYNPKTQWNSTKPKRNVKRATNKYDSIISRRPKYTLPVYDGPDPIYPRILLFVNYLDIYFTSDREVRFYELLIYLVSFWNGVEMKFTEFEYPTIKFHIAGIVIGNNKWAAPWLQTTESLYPRNPQYMQALQNFASHVVENDPLPGRWDTFLDQTNIKFTQRFDDSQPSVAGMTRIGITCNFLPNALNTLKAIIISDNLSFHGIDIAAHEIGHALGADHDGNGVALCDDHQFVMSQYVSSQKSPVETWSWCSKFQILQYLRNHSKICWQHKPVVNKNDEVPEILPGQIISPDTQCSTRGYGNICNEDAIECDHLRCNNGLFNIKLLGGCEDSGPALDGTRCGNNRSCKNKKCML